jgi:hypothetical protein
MRCRAKARRSAAAGATPRASCAASGASGNDCAARERSSTCLPPRAPAAGSELHVVSAGSGLSCAVSIGSAVPPGTAVPAAAVVAGSATQRSTAPPPAPPPSEAAQAVLPPWRSLDGRGSSAQRCAPDLPRKRCRNLPPHERRARGTGPDKLAPYEVPALPGRRRGGACLRPFQPAAVPLSPERRTAAYPGSEWQVLRGSELHVVSAGPGLSCVATAGTASPPGHTLPVGGGPRRELDAKRHRSASGTAAIGGSS